MQFPVVKLQSLDIRMIPKKMLVVKKQVESPILSKNPRKEVRVWLVFINSALLRFFLQQSKFSLLVIATKAAVHNFAVVRVRVKRRVVGALDLIVRRGAYSFPEGMSKQPSKVGKPDLKGRKPDSEEPGILLHDQTLANPQAWILPGMHSERTTLSTTSLTSFKIGLISCSPRPRCLECLSLTW